MRGGCDRSSANDSAMPVGAAPARTTLVLAEAARAMALSAPEGLKGLRDRALLLLGFASAFRRSELVALDVADLEETEDGYKIVIRRSKTDQEGHGVTIAIARGVTTCPVKAVKAWLQAAGISEGPLFRPVAKGGRLATAYAERIGLKGADFGAHSLRAGFLTSAARRGASVFKMRDVSRHKSMDVLQAYVRDADLFRDHCCDDVCTWREETSERWRAGRLLTHCGRGVKKHGAAQQRIVDSRNAICGISRRPIIQL
jgi:integrase